MDCLFFSVWISCLCSLPLFLLGCLSFAYCVRSSLSLVDISVLPVINAVSVASQPVILQSVHGLPRPVELNMCAQKGFLYGVSAFGSAQKGFSCPKFRQFVPHFFLSCFYRFFVFRFWSFWNLWLYMLRMPILLCWSSYISTNCFWHFCAVSLLFLWLLLLLIFRFYSCAFQFFRKILLGFGLLLHCINLMTIFTYLMVGVRLSELFVLISWLTIIIHSMSFSYFILIIFSLFSLISTQMYVHTNSFLKCLWVVINS